MKQRLRVSFGVVLMIGVTGCSFWLEAVPAEPVRQGADRVQENLQTLEEWDAGAEVRFRDLLPSTPPPQLRGVSASRSGESGVTVVFVHQGVQSLLLHVDDPAELPSCTSIESTEGVLQCVRRETDGVRPFLVYLVASGPEGPVAPSPQQLAAYWQDVPLVSWDALPPWTERS